MPNASLAPKREGLRRYSVVHFFFVLVFLIFITPLTSHLEHYQLVDSVLITLVLISAVAAVGGSRKALVIGLVLVTPALLGTWFNHFHRSLAMRVITLVFDLVFVLFVVTHLVIFIMRAPRVNAEVLCGGMATYILLGMLWAFAYVLESLLSPGAFMAEEGPHAGKAMAGFEALYYSFSTLTAGGYSDFRPVSNTARMLSMLEATVGVFYVTIFIARLVALYSAVEETPGKSTQR